MKTLTKPHAIDVERVLRDLARTQDKPAPPRVRYSVYGMEATGIFFMALFSVMSLVWLFQALKVAMSLFQG